MLYRHQDGTYVLSSPDGEFHRDLGRAAGDATLRNFLGKGFELRPTEHRRLTGAQEADPVRRRKDGEALADRWIADGRTGFLVA